MLILISKKSPRPNIEIAESAVKISSIRKQTLMLLRFSLERQETHLIDSLYRSVMRPQSMSKSVLNYEHYIQRRSPTPSPSHHHHITIIIISPTVRLRHTLPILARPLVHSSRTHVVSQHSPTSSSCLALARSAQPLEALPMRPCAPAQGWSAGR